MPNESKFMTPDDLTYYDGKIKKHIGDELAKQKHRASDINSGTFDTARLPVVPVYKGGTGAGLLTSNAVLLGNGTGAVKQAEPSSGALYATGPTSKPTFGTLPITQGGTGSTSGSTALSNLGIRKWLLDNIFRVGYVWVSYTSTSPAGIIGGTWTAITGKFPYFNAGTEVGGSNYTSHRHWMPVGKENGAGGFSTTAIKGWADGETYDIRSGAVYHSIYVEDMYVAPENGNATETTTYDATVSNMPSYQTLYAWRRTE